VEGHHSIISGKEESSTIVLVMKIDILSLRSEKSKHSIDSVIDYSQNYLPFILPFEIIF